MWLIDLALLTAGLVYLISLTVICFGSTLGYLAMSESEKETANKLLREKSILDFMLFAACAPYILYIGIKRN